MLAREGRTVVTTIHQPSALILEMFDNVYALAKGYCIYDGPTSQLIPHLASKGLQCPVYHNPADFRKHLTATLFPWNIFSKRLLNDSIV